MPGPDPAQGKPGKGAGRQVPEQRRPGRAEDQGNRCGAGRLPRGTERGVRSGRGGHGVSDVELLARMREGDDRAYEELYRRHAEPVRRYARTCCRDADTAEDLTGEVFARTLQAVRGGRGPEASVRAYLLASVRRVAADWARTRRRERLVDDFAAFAQAAAAGSASGEGETLAPGAEVRAMREAEQKLIVRAFRSLSEYDRMLLWHTTVEGVSPQEVAPLLGKSRGATATAAHRAREHLKQAYLQAHVSQALTTEGGACARYADRLGAYARGGLRMRAERGLARHLEECPACRQAASEVRDLNEHIRLLVPVALVGWLGTAGGAQAFGALLGTGAPTAGGAAVGGAAAGSGAAAAGGSAAAGSSAATGGSGGAGAGGAGGAASEGLGAPAKAGIGLGVVAAAGAVLAYALSGGADEPSEKPEARHPAPTAAPGRPGEPGEPLRKPDPAPRPGTPGSGPAASDPAPPRKEAEESRPATSPAPVPAAEPSKPEPPRRTPPPAPPRPGPPRPAPPPAPPARHVVEITRDTVTLSSGTGDRTVRLVVKRHPATVGGAVSVKLSAPNWPHSSSNRSTARTPVSGGRRAAPPAGE